MSELELILAKLKLVSEEEERGYYLCDKEHSKILLDEIDKLNKEINKEMALTTEYESKYYEMLDKYKRLNNIINELETWAEDYRFANIFKNKK